jgi:aldose sugar dehydrogenase
MIDSILYRFSFLLAISFLILCQVHTTTGAEGPIITDPAIKAEIVVQGLELPTSMAFLGPDDILVLEKNKGTVQRIINGTMLPEPLLDVNVSTASERGMIGIAVSGSNRTGANLQEGNLSSTYVFLYYTQAETGDGDDRLQGKEPLGNRLYRYELLNDKLVNPKLLLDLPGTPGPAHNGGVVIIGPDNNLYLAIGDVRGKNPQQRNGTALDGRSGILRVTQDGKQIDGGGILGDEHPLNKYYAYGIRNSFGLDFDPISGKLWDTENGQDYGDEINLVEPGFNSGWREVQGKSSIFHLYHNKTVNPNDLVDFDGKGEYSDPEFSWNATVGVTGIKFLNSDKLGSKYENDMFVGEFHKGYLYHFDLNKNRTELSLNGSLDDKVANNRDELKPVVFGQGFDAITDIDVGPDGYLYVVSIHLDGIYRIVPKNTTIQYNNTNQLQ